MGRKRRLGMEKKMKMSKELGIRLGGEGLTWMK